MSYHAIRPHNLPLLPPKIDNLSHDVYIWLLRARAELGELKGYSFALPNPMLLLSPAILKEALASSEIENINTTMERVLQQQLFPESEQRVENKEVLRYKEAILYGYTKMEDVSISSRLIKEIHKILLAEKSFGYRKNQNQIENSATKTIIYTPPSANNIESLIADWEKYLHNEEDPTDPLLKCAIAHYQFEAIHPFHDGNGRTGRILMVLYLIKEKILHYPILFISGYINKNRADYYKLLQNITEKSEWNEYLIYMLQAFCLQAIETKTQLFSVMKLFYETKSEIKKNCKAIYHSDLVDSLFAHPIITPVKLGSILDVHYTTATRYLKELTEKNFLEHKRVGKYQLYINSKLIGLLEKQ